LNTAFLLSVKSKLFVSGRKDLISLIVNLRSRLKSSMINYQIRLP